MTHTYAYHQHTSAITSNVHVHNVGRCHLQSHLALRDTTHTMSDTGYMHFIIGNVTGEHLQRCHNLIIVCKNDTAVGTILNTNSEEAFSRQICTLSDNVMPAGEIGVSTTVCFHITRRGNFIQEIRAAKRGLQEQRRSSRKQFLNVVPVLLKELKHLLESSGTKYQSSEVVL